MRITEDPYEIWVGFGRNILTGKVEVRRRYVKGVAVRKGKVLGLIAEAVAGQWVSYNYTLGRLDRSTLRGLRVGYLAWGRSP
ncbi:MAG: hypothetical protein ACPGZP_04725 [Panacagrimonas sp.]